MKYFGTWVDFCLYIVSCKEKYNAEVIFSLFPFPKVSNQMFNRGKPKKILYSCVCLSWWFWMGFWQKRVSGLNGNKFPQLLICPLIICECIFLGYAHTNAYQLLYVTTFFYIFFTSYEHMFTFLNIDFKPRLLSSDKQISSFFCTKYLSVKLMFITKNQKEFSSKNDIYTFDCLEKIIDRMK